MEPEGGIRFSEGSMDKGRHANVIRTWKVERISKRKGLVSRRQPDGENQRAPRWDSTRRRASASNITPERS